MLSNIRWIIQEASLPPETLVLTGRYELRLADILHIPLWVIFKSIHVDQDIMNAFQTAFTLAEYATENSPWCVRSSKRFLSSALVGAHNFEASDPRDLVYGILGLTLTPTLLRPDYSASVLEVYRDSIKAGIAEHGGLTILRDVRPRPGDSSDRPSWILQLDRKFDRSHDSPHFAQIFHACDNRLIEHNCVKGRDPGNPWLLTVRGFLVGKIHEHTNCMSGYFDGYRAALLMWEVAASLSETQIPTSELCFALTAGINHRRQRATEQILETFRAYRAYVERHGRDPPKSLSSAPEERYAAEYHQAMYTACLNRKLFVTSNGSYGLGPRTMQVGDLICVLDGGDVPAVLRPSPGGTEYRWIGFCYISNDDLMFGDVARRHAAECKPYETFAIR